MDTKGKREGPPLGEILDMSLGTPETLDPAWEEFNCVRKMNLINH